MRPLRWGCHRRRPPPPDPQGTRRRRPQPQRPPIRARPLPLLSLGTHRPIIRDHPQPAGLITTPANTSPALHHPPRDGDRRVPPPPHRTIRVPPRSPPHRSPPLTRGKDGHPAPPPPAPPDHRGMDRSAAQVGYPPAVRRVGVGGISGPDSPEPQLQPFFCRTEFCEKLHKVGPGRSEKALTCGNAAKSGRKSW
jgi:Wiskott-Aldrich syndrome protein